MELYRCGWCGQPTTKDGEPLGMFRIILIEDLRKWDDAILVPGECCANNPDVTGHVEYENEESDQPSDQPSDQDR